MKTVSLFSAFIVGCSLACAQDAPPSDGGLSAIVQPQVDSHVTPGAVILVGDKDKVLDVETVGFADIENQVPMKADDIFAIASMSKPICATAIMMLVDEGKLSVEDPVEKYIPEFKDKVIIDPKDKTKTPHPAQSPITIRELLTHSSGLPYSTPEEKPSLDGNSLKDAAQLYAKSPIAFEPGTKFSYASAGINTAARIVEIVSGMPYEQFLQDRLFTPLGMVDTTFWPTEDQLKRHPEFYSSNVAKNGLMKIQTKRFIYPLSDHTKRFPIPGSGLFSTASDMYKFCRMILNGGVWDGKTYLTPASLKAMTTRETPTTWKQNYGFGWETGDGIGHGGSYHTFMRIQQNLIVIVMQQVEGAFPRKDGDKIFGNVKKAAFAKYATPVETHPAGQ